MNQNEKPVICVIGMGYVGLPLAAVAASKGYTVYGFDNDQKKLDLIKQGLSPFKEEFLEQLLPKVKINVFSNPKLMSECDIHIICVPTPVDDKYFPDLGPVISASETVAKNMRKGSLVILESTVNPGVSEEFVKPIFEKAGYEIGKDVFISHCPERVNPGDPKWNVSNIPRVVGSFDEIGLKRSQEFYESIVDAKIMPMATIREAEAVKITENSFRDINIAFVNELARSFERMDIDVTNVIKGASTKPFSFLAHWPSCGVGGHCIPVDPYYLIEKAKENDFDHVFLRAARKINNSMPEYTIELLQDQLNEIEKSLKGTIVGVLGLSYKANVGDLRESPSFELIKLLEKNGAKVVTFDPFVPAMSSTKSIDELLEKSEAVLLATNHQEFINIPVEKFVQSNIKVITDGKNCLNKAEIQKHGIIYKGIGR
ncbi:MAG: Nucleotide sugar dehydrogenase [Candidatus Moranbacteria bacterium GW2011_GWE1_36_7]|nr:MAG: Nucleotide sugar dehydrogenase [Candidatus Moranbacteria bacterium GW2011_GWD2_36_12]KKQ04757.1 MAG: Nucleotide sugar dehydrogenase [Candidatus Moranbacteria bacterium GW2011_GWE2_36_40]KKQ13547.1 MAG: Nucleotide sugar dehydrogenase [Candidatus Moranbacteria bacterium GW2011_GWE1_36_7]